MILEQKKCEGKGATNVMMQDFLPNNKKAAAAAEAARAETAINHAHLPPPPPPSPVLRPRLWPESEFPDGNAERSNLPKIGSLEI